MDYGMQDYSGVEPHAVTANLRMVWGPVAGSFPVPVRVFRRQRGIGKRSAPGVRDRYPLWGETHPAGLGPPKADRARPTATPIQVCVGMGCRDELAQTQGIG